MSGFGCGCGCNGKPGGCSDSEGMGLFGFAGIASSLGLGCDCQETDADGNCLDPDPCTTANTGSSSCTGPLGSCPGDTAALNAPVNSGNTYSTASGTPTVNVTVTNPSTGQSASSNIVATDLSNLGTQFAKIFGNIVAPQTTITTASGTQISTPASQTANLAGVLSGTSALSASSISAYLPWILGLGAAFMLISAMGKK